MLLDHFEPGVFCELIKTARGACWRLRRGIKAAFHGGLFEEIIEIDPGGICRRPDHIREGICVGPSPCGVINDHNRSNAPKEISNYFRQFLYQ
jgi:hypothetical protein